MIAFASMLAEAATQAEMKIPADPDEWEEAKDEFPHFFVYCALQLGAPLPTPDAHWENAKVVAKIPVDKLKTMTAKDFVKAGFRTGFSK